MTLKEKRKELGLTQAKMGDTLNVEWITIARWEKGETRPYKKKIELIKKIYPDVDTSTFKENSK